MIITSLHNDKLKHIRALQSAGKIRRAEKQIVLDGVRLIADALDSGLQPAFALYSEEATTVDKPAAQLLERLQAQGVDCTELSPELMAQISETQTPQGILAVVPIPDLVPPKSLTLLLILDGIADPGNMGTILRTAAASGVEGVLLAPGCVDAYNAKVLRGGMGAHFRVAIRKLGWSDILEKYGALPMYLADAHAETAYTSVDWKQPAALIIGGEAYGANEQAQHAAAQQIAIPMSNAAELLNAAVAASVILFEARRQRGL